MILLDTNVLSELMRPQPIPPWSPGSMPIPEKRGLV